MTDVLNKLLSCVKLKLASALGVNTVSRSLLTSQREIACVSWKQQSCNCECAGLPSGWRVVEGSYGQLFFSQSFIIHHKLI